MKCEIDVRPTSPGAPLGVAGVLCDPNGLLPPSTPGNSYVLTAVDWTSNQPPSVLALAKALAERDAEIDELRRQAEKLNESNKTLRRAVDKATNDARAIRSSLRSLDSRYAKADAALNAVGTTLAGALQNMPGIPVTAAATFDDDELEF